MTQAELNREVAAATGETMSAVRHLGFVPLAEGETTSVTAAKFRVSLGRISQLRRELHDDWERFHGECAVSVMH